MTALVAVLAASATLAGLWPRRWSRAVMPGRPDVVGPAVAWPGRPVSLPTRPRVVRPRDPRPDTAEEPALCAELLAVAAAAGSSVAEAVVGVGRAPGTGAAMRACADSLERGTDLIDRFASSPAASTPQNSRCRADSAARRASARPLVSST